MSTNLDTFSGWIRVGRTVKKGQSAKQYAVFEDGTRLGVFHLDQTDEDPRRDVNTAVRFITAEEHAEMRKAEKLDRLKVTIPAQPNDDGTYALLFWCGSSKRGIEMMQNSKFRYYGDIHRWKGNRPDPDSVIEALKRRRFSVEVEDLRNTAVEDAGAFAI